MKQTQRKMIQDVPNPNFDGRKRYGLDAVRTFKAGETVIVMDGLYEKYLPAHVTYGRQSGPVGRDLYERILAASAPQEVQSWDEVVRVLGVGDWVSGAVLQKLIDSGTVSVKEVFSLACQVAGDECADDERADEGGVQRARDSEGG